MISFLLSGSFVCSSTWSHCILKKRTDSLELLGSSATPCLRDTETLYSQLPNRTGQGVLLSRFSGEERHAQTPCSPECVTGRNQICKATYWKLVLWSVWWSFLTKLIQPRGQHSFFDNGLYRKYYTTTQLLWTVTAAISNTMVATGFQ